MKLGLPGYLDVQPLGNPAEMLSLDCMKSVYGVAGYIGVDLRVMVKAKQEKVALVVALLRRELRFTSRPIALLGNYVCNLSAVLRYGRSNVRDVNAFAADRATPSVAHPDLSSNSFGDWQSASL